MTVAANPRPVLLMCRELGLGGSERQLCEIAKALDRSRFKPHVGCFRAHGFRAEELRAAGVPVVEFSVRSFRSPATLREVRRVGEYLERHWIQVVHTFDFPLNLFGVPVAKLFRAPVVLSSQRCDRKLYPEIVRSLLRVTDQIVDGVVVNCEAVRSQMIVEEHAPPRALHVCYNGVDTAVFQAGPRRRPPALRDASLVIGVICVLRPEKGLETLVEAFARVREIRPGLKLALVGDGPMETPLRSLAERLGVAADCHFEPATRDVPLWLRAIDVFVLPSLSEAFSNSLAEAMACGCCVVASSAGGNPELVEDGRTGLLFPPANAAELAERLERVIRDDALREEMGAAAAARIRRQFSIARSARRMEEIYTSLVATSGEQYTGHLASAPDTPE
jgi:glycosyltransferase involved in cell wall biosynthesis